MSEEQSPVLGFAVVHVDEKNSNIIGFGQQRLFDKESAKIMADALSQREGKIYRAAALIDLKSLEL